MLNSKMKKTLLTLLLVFFMGFGALTLSSCGAAGDTPTIEIPAPVSHLSISSPDISGNVRITGSAGAADVGTTVTILNENVQNGLTSQILNLFIRSAWAHATHTTAAAADGSFQNEIEGEVGDIIKVTLTLDGETSTTDLIVPAKTPPLSLASEIQDVSADPISRSALVSANDGTDGFIHVIDLESFTFTETLMLAGASSATRIATDPTTGETVVLDTANVDAWHITLDGGAAVVSTTPIIPSSDVAAGPSGGYVLIAHTDSSPALSFFDLTTDAATAVGDSEAEDSTDQTSALLVALDNDGSDDIAGVISLMPDGTHILTTHVIDPGVPSITQNGAIVLDIATPRGLVLFNNATEALVTDAETDQVLRVLLADGSVTAITVGDAPRGVVVNEAAGEASVVNNGDRTLSVITLATNTVSTTTEIGLAPTEIALDANATTPILATVNTGDETATLVE